MIQMFIVIITGKDITMEKDITAGRLDITVPETEAAGNERHERSQVLVLSAADQLHHVHRDRTSDHKACMMDQGQGIFQTLF